jgi:hypothetical protein
MVAFRSVDLDALRHLVLTRDGSGRRKPVIRRPRITASLSSNGLLVLDLVLLPAFGSDARAPPTPGPPPPPPTPPPTPPPPPPPPPPTTRDLHGRGQRFSLTSASDQELAQLLSRSAWPSSSFGVSPSICGLGPQARVRVSIDAGQGHLVRDVDVGSRRRSRGCSRASRRDREVSDLEVVSRSLG